MPYPEILFSEAERFREQELLEIGKAFAKEMENRGNTYALKGGTALRFLLKMPRPSRDLDFEGEQQIWVRRHVKRALRAAFPNTRYSVSYDFMRTGEIAIEPPKNHGSAGLRLGIDYRDSRFEDIPKRIPVEECTRYNGIIIYKPAELVHRKLQTMVGRKARCKPRDLYDAGWIATTHPELISEEDARKLKNWITSRTPRQIQDLKTGLAEDPITRNADTTDLWECVVRGISRLGTRDHGNRQATMLLQPDNRKLFSGREIDYSSETIVIRGAGEPAGGIKVPRRQATRKRGDPGGDGPAGHNR